MMELLSPAGDFTKLKAALLYGADAVYCGIGEFSLRAIKLDYDELKKCIDYTHKLHKKIYCTANIFARNMDIQGLKEYMQRLNEYKPDGIIVSDLAAFSLAKEHTDIDIHISTQANTTNFLAAKEWQKLGAKRIILARELTLSEISEIKQHCPDLELEIFVHGAMCMAISGRCLLSQYLTGRNANLGACAQPCRWEVSIEEDHRGAYIFNAKDLCLIDMLKEIEAAGVSSIKIEGRNKSDYYVAAVTKAYRQKLDSKPSPFSELEKISHREYCGGFIEGNFGQNYESSAYIRSCEVVGVVLSWNNGKALVEQRNKIFFGDTIEILQPRDVSISIIAQIYDESGDKLESTPHATMHYYLDCPQIEPGSFIRR